MKIIVDLCNQHFGSLEELKRMSLNAFLSGADAVKIQLLDSEKLLGTKDKKYRDICFQDAYELAKYCDNLGIEFMASVFDEERFKWFVEDDEDWDDYLARLGRDGECSPASRTLWLASMA